MPTKLLSHLCYEKIQFQGNFCVHIFHLTLKFLIHLQIQSSQKRVNENIFAELGASVLVTFAAAPLSYFK